MKKMKKKKGFSLVELLIVIGISGILMAIAAPKYQGMIDKAKEVEQKSYIRETLNYVDVYNLNKSDAQKITEANTLTEANTKLQSSSTDEAKADLTALLEDIKYDGSTIAKLRQYVEGKIPNSGLTLDVTTP